MITRVMDIDGKNERFIEFDKNKDGAIEAYTGVLGDDMYGVTVHLNYNELKKAIAVLDDKQQDNANNQDLIIAIRELLMDYHFTVNGGVIDDSIAYDAFATNMMCLMEQYKNGAFCYDFRPFVMPLSDEKEISEVK